MKEDVDQMKVSVPIKDLWRAMATDNRYVVPKVLPDIVSEVELLEGDGGLGSMLVFKFWPHVPKVSYQREKIVEYNESQYEIALEILEGGHLDHGFTAYTTAFKLTELGEAETLIDMKVLYETKPEYNHIPGETLKATFRYLKSVENYLLKGSP
uniref:phytohormone-binding protein CSBP-like n=1 Tax=Erigeron canadensis TaxID=72917 RepID=UPI001CB8D4EC|nr:phytohormone-binding protein CSBP-like [Erigeron canadensis]